METIPLRGCTLALDRREIIRGDQVHVLSTLETELLAWLLRHVDEPISRDTLLIEVWGFPHPVMTRAVDNTVMRLRSKIEVDPKNPDHLLTLRGVGYRFVLSVGEAAEAPPLRRPPPSVAADFLGREAALAGLEAALEASRLVTVLGPGGCGKTRLTREWSRERSGVIFCDLASAEQSADIMAQVARGVGASTATPAAIREALAAVAVLLLDNVESVTEAVAAWIPEALAAAPQLRVLCTSRERLHLRAEHLLELGPLDDDAACALLRHRLQILGVEDPDGEDVAAIVAQLGGLPLAIELAAARSRSMSLPRLRVALSEGLGVLVSRDRDRPARHRTMTAVIQWSWERLEPVHQAVLFGLSLLPDGIDLDTLEATADTGEHWPLDLLEDLRDRSLLLATEGFEGDARFGLLEVIRRFVAACLAERGDWDVIEDRMLDWFVARSLRWRHGVHGPQPAESIRRLRLERANLLALARRARHRRPADCAQIIYNLGWHLLNESADVESLRLGVEAADDSDSSRLQIDNRLLLGRMLEWTGQIDAAEAMHHEALEMARAREPQRLAIATFHVAAHRARRRDLPGVEALCQEGLSAAAAHELPGVAAMLHNRLGNTLRECGEIEAAIPVLEQATRGYHDTGQETAVPYPMWAMANCWLAAGRLSAAEAKLAESEALAVRLGIVRLVVSVRQDEGWLRIYQGRPEAVNALLLANSAALRTLADPAMDGTAALLAAAAALELGEAVDEAALSQARMGLLRAGYETWAVVASLLLAWESEALLTAARREAEGLQSADLLALADWAAHSLAAACGDPMPLRRALSASTEHIGLLWHLGRALAVARWDRQRSAR